MPRIKIRDGEGMSNLINNSVLTEVEVDGTIKAPTRNVGKKFFIPQSQVDDDSDFDSYESAEKSSIVVHADPN